MESELLYYPEASGFQNLATYFDDCMFHTAAK